MLSGKREYFNSKGCHVAHTEVTTELRLNIVPSKPLSGHGRHERAVKCTVASNCIEARPLNLSSTDPTGCYTVSIRVNPFTPESDQCQNSPAASQEVWHHTVWRTWLFIAYSDEKWLYYKFSLHHSYNRFLKGWENTLFELRSERVKRSGLGFSKHD